SSDANAILRGIIYNLISGGLLTIMLNPQLAKSLAEDGWTKKEIAAFICEHARVPAYRSRRRGGRGPIDPQDSVSIMGNPDLIKLLVAGGAGGLAVGLIAGGYNPARWGTIPGQRVIKKVELPANWNKLVQKYKDMVPIYVRY
ncbi:hypothetical protein ACFLXU_02285, partial [Chloroflexota bacterium]